MYVMLHNLQQDYRINSANSDLILQAHITRNFQHDSMVILPLGPQSLYVNLILILILMHCVVNC